MVVAAEAGAFRLRAEGLRVEAYHYVEVRGGGVLEGEGTLFAATAGSARADVAVDGAARLPYATLDGRRVGTVALEGEVALGGLQPSGDALQATVSGQYTGARLDETAVEPAALGGWQPAAAAVGVSAAVGLGLALPWLLRLRVRDPATALAHPTRKRILEAAKEHPGTSTHELARISQVPWTTFQHHLAILERVDCVVRHRIGKVWRVYENHGRYGAADRVALATFQNPAVRSLDLWLSRKVRATQSDAVAYAAGSLGIPRATAQTHMERLVGAGRATTWKRRGRRWYETTDPSV